MHHRFYLLGKKGPPVLMDIFDGREDTEKKPEIPERSGRAARLKAAIDEQGEKARRIWGKFSKRMR